jgi:hypothetical protein
MLPCYSVSAHAAPQHITLKVLIIKDIVWSKASITAKLWEFHASYILKQSTGHYKHHSLLHNLIVGNDSQGPPS